MAMSGHNVLRKIFEVLDTVEFPVCVQPMKRLKRGEAL